MKQRSHIRIAIVGIQVALVLLVGLFVALGVSGILSTTMVRATPGWNEASVPPRSPSSDAPGATPPNVMVYDRNLFNQSAEPAEAAAPPPLSTEPGDDEGAAPAPSEGTVITASHGQPVESDLALTLLGTMVSDAPGASIAHVRTPQNEDLYVRVGGQVPGARIERIAREFVLLRRDERPQGPLEYLSLYGRGPGAGSRVASNRTQLSPPPPQPMRVAPVVPAQAPEPAVMASNRAFAEVPEGAIEKVSEGEFALSRELVLEQNKMSADLARALELEPISDNGAPIGMRLGHVETGTLFDQVGLRPGDVIVGVDGVEALDERTASDFLQHLERQGEVAIEIDRRGRREKVRLLVR